MCVEVLKSRSDIKLARRELNRRKLSFTTPWWKRFGRKRNLPGAIEVGDELKSWDVLKTVTFIEKHLGRAASILDMGAFASEVPCILHKLNYCNLAGVDLNPDIKAMPYASSVRYEVADFMHTPFSNESFDIITAISVIEHGYQGHALLRELSRLLRPGGYFVASFDYWPEKINSDGIKIFGMDWRIFSAEEVRTFIEEAAKYDLVPPGDISLDSAEKPIRSAERDYTFAWLVLRKTTRAKQ
jgi:SAM-dependent methyltransferase